MNECVVDKEHSGRGLPDPLSTFPICSHARILPLIIFPAGVWIPSAFVRADAFSLTQIGGGVIFQTESWAGLTHFLSIEKGSIISLCDRSQHLKEP